ncbi:Thioesterase [Segniliparus rotundus DSM 44985]|uniref:Thioesterase TesA n=1 Tax=Segniliparus rotundus (strain ATCC BAA-972 / CDC 1076 / CIP 108378 / DSM 44985 / JCM 13578) TaxID=640132 RepID=D6ZEG8_SEGRD|nr:alpha/beta fold hydrolase [Segniliparus rotundus]ADG99444.1 Thioesterase [Segniliparus rotundus DSM 44985]
MTKLLCFHHAGGSPSAFRAWQTAAPPGIEVVPVELPTTRPVAGRRVHTGAREIVEHVLDKHAAALRERHALYGHSMGGLLAYLVARSVLGSFEFARTCTLIVAASWSPRLRPITDVDALTDPELVELLARIGGVPQSLLNRPEWLYPLLPLVRDDLRLCADYQHDPVDDRLAIPVHVIGAREDRLVSAQQIQGWAELSGYTTIEHQPGGHFFEASPEQLRERVFELAAQSSAGAGGLI